MARNTCTVNEGVKLTEVLGHPCHHGLYLGAIGDINGHGRRVESSLHHLIGNLMDEVIALVHYDDSGAHLGEYVCTLPPNALGGTDDHRESSLHVLLIHFYPFRILRIPLRY
jgi:hypothetical protein